MEGTFAVESGIGDAAVATDDRDVSGAEGMLQRDAALKHQLNGQYGGDVRSCRGTFVLENRSQQLD